jgi:hypothetical protein
VEKVTEVWRPVVGREGLYEVSDQGRVRSLDRWGRGGRGGRYPKLYRGKLRQPHQQKSGHLLLLLHADGQIKGKEIHTLVAEAFIGPRPEGQEVCHNNGDPADNRVENLRYDTHSANLKDSVRHGTQSSIRKTACPEGHPYDVLEGITRRCRTCRRKQQSEAYRRKRDALVVR